MRDKVCIVSGSNSGIGKETALALASFGAKVVMLVRNEERGEKAISEIIKQTGNHNTALMMCDLSSFDSIRRFLKEFAETYDALDVLINNAGAVFDKRQITDDGFERTLAVNYLGPFFLTQKLLPLLKSSIHSRIVNVSSGLHKSGQIDLDDLQSERKYNGMRVYASVKLMVLMYTYELARRLADTGVTVNAVLPGFVATNLGRNSGSHLSSLMFRLVRPFQISAKQGAETSVYLASSREVEGVTGKCFSKIQETRTSPASYDRKLQILLWDATIKLLEGNSRSFLT